jgi:hypothetical protein
MSFGCKIVLNNGRVIDSTKLTGLIHDVFVVSGSSSGSKSYPELAGFIVYSAVQKFFATPNGIIFATVSYSLGYPTVNWAPTGSGSAPSDATILVFVK